MHEAGSGFGDDFILRELLLLTRAIAAATQTDAPPQTPAAASTMSTTHREGVNPLRPYYIPPTIGEAADPVAAANANPFSGRNATSSARYASKARDVLADLDYKDYLRDSSPSVVQSVKELVDELIWKYTSVLMAQPFEVAKTILQARDQDDNAALATASEPGSLKRQASGQAASIYDVCADAHLVLPPLKL